MDVWGGLAKQMVPFAQDNIRVAGLRLALNVSVWKEATFPGKNDYPLPSAPPNSLSNNQKEEK